METISTADPIAFVYAGGALFVAYLLLPPVFSFISFGLRGYKGNFTYRNSLFLLFAFLYLTLLLHTGALTPAQTLDTMCTKNYVMIDIRSEKDKNKDGIPRLPSAARNQLIAIP